MGLGVQIRWDIVKGSSDSKTISVYVNGVKQNLVTGDKVELQVRETADSSVALISKSITTFTDGNAEITLTATDTDITAGKYKYDIKVTFANDDTLVPVYYSDFIVIPNVTR